MGNELNIKDLEKKILLCNRCGTCQDVCPTFKASGNEGQVARSRIRLIRLILEGKYRWGDDPELTDCLNSCLLCKACVTQCPSNVPTDLIMRQARKELNQVKGMPLFDRLIYRGLLSRQERMVFLSKLLRFYQTSGLQRFLEKNVLTKITRAGQMEELLPKLPEQTLRGMLPDLIRPIQNPVRRVGYFPGCATNVFYSRIGRASIEVLQENRCLVHVPDTVCCGGPHQSCGDLDEAVRLAKKNIDAMWGLDLDAILTDCATCGSTLKEYAELLKNDEDYSGKAEWFSKKIKDINEFLVEIGITGDLAPMPIRVSYHDPCHLSRGQKITDAPRRIIRCIPGLELVEMKEADMCCGGAGSYGAHRPDMSRKILDRKMANFEATGADYLVTSCPSCTMQLEFGMRRHGLKTEVVHPVELLARSYRLSKS